MEMVQHGPLGLEAVSFIQALKKRASCDGGIECITSSGFGCESSLWKAFYVHRRKPAERGTGACSFEEFYMSSSQIIVYITACN